MLLGLGVSLIGVLLVIWGMYNVVTVSRSKQGVFNLLDIIINGAGSGVGMIIGGLVFTVIGIVLMFQ